MIAGRRLAIALMVASGFAGLGYQIAWTQQATAWLGHEAAAVLAVVAAFFGGLAVGALALGARIERSARPGRWYAACELVIGLWSLVLALLMTPASAWLLDLIGPTPAAGWQWSVAFAGTFVLLLPATAAMGATLPAMARVTTEGVSIAALYAANTFGAVAGVLVTAFWLVPALGLARTAAICAALNFGCAVAAWKLFTGAVATERASGDARGVLPLLAATGFLGIGYEVLVVRVLSQVTENTVYTFALLLAVYLVGTALGAATYRRWPANARLIWLLAAACLLGGLSLWRAPSLSAALGHGLASEAILAIVAFVLPSFMMGAVFSALATRARAAGIGFGRALGVNTLGAAAAPLIIGVLLAPAIGAKLTLVAIVAGYVALSWPRDSGARAPWASVLALVALALWAPTLAIIDVPAGGRLVYLAEGAMATVSVVEDAHGVLRLHINNRQQEGSSASGHADARQALLPILLHPAPRRALFLGLGTGVTARAAAAEPGLEVDAVELLPEVIEASAHFGAPAPRLHVIAGDARRYARTTRERYDVIVSDNFHPARSGSAALYTVEHFSAVRDRLAPGGLFCQWIPLHQLDLHTLRSIVRSFLAANPGAWAMLATHSLETPVVGLLARRDAPYLHVGALNDRLERAAPRGINDELALLGGFIAGPASLARFAAGAPLNTDDRPIVAYTAPQITYAADSLARDRLGTLLRAVEIHPDELLERPDPRLAAYWRARDRFIEAGRDVQPSTDVRRMLAQVREPLLAVLRISPEFRPAYEPLVRMASALAVVDPEAAHALRSELEEIRGGSRHAEHARGGAFALRGCPRPDAGPDEPGC